MRLYYIVLFSAAFIYILATLFYYFKDTDYYTEKLQGIRKGFYALFILGVGTGFLVKEIPLQDWQSILELVTFAVFIDLAIFQTPTITKIGQAEFQQSNYVLKTLEVNNETLRYSSKKVERFTSIVIDTEEYFSNKDPIQTWGEYREELCKYVSLYTDTFQCNLSIYRIDIANDDEGLKENISKAFKQIEQGYNLKLLDEDYREQLLHSFLKGESHPIKDDIAIENEHPRKLPYVVIYYGEEYHFFLTISSSFIEVNGIDASHILNLTHIFDWYMT